jgi:actin-related protein
MNINYDIDYNNIELLIIIKALPELLISSINKSDMDLRKTLCNEILLAGGTTLI